MANKFYCPGPSFIYCAVGAGGSYVQLGYTEDTVEIVTGAEHEKINVDFAAGMAGDYLYRGEEIVVSFKLASYSETVFALVRQRLKTALSTAPGMGLAGALGSLLKAEGNTYGLAIRSCYGSAGPAAKTQFSDMTPGFVIPNAFLAGDTSQRLGMNIKTPTVMFRGIANFGGNGALAGGEIDGSYVLFHSNLTGLGLPDPN